MEKYQIWSQTNLGGFFPANPDLADILREMDFDFENCFGREGLGPQIWPDNFKTFQMP